MKCEGHVNIQHMHYKDTYTCIPACEHKATLKLSNANQALQQRGYAETMCLQAPLTAENHLGKESVPAHMRDAPYFCNQIR